MSYLKKVGVRRLGVLGILLGVNAIILACYALWILPATMLARSDLASVEGQISEISGKLQTVKGDLAAFQGNYERYNVLNQSGFFSNQDRFSAARELDLLRERSGVLGFTYNIGAVDRVANAEAQASNAEFLKSEIKIDAIVSVFDNGVYNLVSLLDKFSKQHMRVESFEIKRTTPLNEETLRQLGTEKMGLVSASIAAYWYTMVPKTTTPVDQPGDAGFRGR